MKGSPKPPGPWTWRTIWGGTDPLVCRVASRQRSLPDPRGLKDILFAAANFGRNLLGVHVELAFLSLILGGLLVGLDLAVWQWADCIAPGGDCVPLSGLNMGLIGFFFNRPTLWIALAPIAWVGAVLSCTYWALPTRKGQRLGAQRMLTALLACGVLHCCCATQRIG